MAFGQSLGPPATVRQLEELVGLLRAAGHADFRDARGPMGFTQRQAGGRFTREEADELIARLQSAAAEPATAAAPRTAAVPRTGSAPRTAGAPRTAAAPRTSGEPAGRHPAPVPALAGVDAEVLAAELQRRGWLVVEPLGTT